MLVLVPESKRKKKLQIYNLSRRNPNFVTNKAVLLHDKFTPLFIAILTIHHKGEHNTHYRKAFKSNQEEQCCFIKQLVFRL